MDLNDYIILARSIHQQHHYCLRCFPATSDWKHPHACGEYPIISLLSILLAETPPRMWGILISKSLAIDSVGNTPTHVGNTIGKIIASTNKKKHPHACGEYWLFTYELGKPSETPPRMWEYSS